PTVRLSLLSTSRPRRSGASSCAPPPRDGRFWRSPRQQDRQSLVRRYHQFMWSMAARSFRLPHERQTTNVVAHSLALLLCSTDSVADPNAFDSVRLLDKS